MGRADSSLLIVIVVVTSTICSVEGVRCFTCHSAADGDVCGKTFKLTSSNTSFIKDNCGYCSLYHFTGDGVIIRSCAKESYSKLIKGCDTCKLSGYTVRACYCDDNLCNSAVTWKTELNILVLPVYLILKYKK